MTFLLHLEMRLWCFLFWAHPYICWSSEWAKMSGTCSKQNKVVKLERLCCRQLGIGHLCCKQLAQVTAMLSLSIPKKKVNLALKKTLQLYIIIIGSNGGMFHLHLSKHSNMFFCKFLTFLPVYHTRERWSPARKINGLKRWRYKSWRGICKNVEIRLQTLVFPGGKILNSCTLPLQWPLPQQSFFQNDLTLVWSPSVEPKWENKMALDLLTH